MSIKRLIDIVSSIGAILLLSPIYLLIAILIKLESRGPVVFVQSRVGKQEKSFRIYKFRTMITHSHTPEELGPVKHNHAVVTRIGYFLRRAKLDEIPQFFNVFFGEMSIVGPRPILFSTLHEMEVKARLIRSKVLPGITGWSEVNGNVELSWKEQLLLDLWYVDHHSIRLDMEIIAKTIVTIFVGSIRNKKAIFEAEQYQQILQDTQG